ncbi:MAG TPA: hypothetical protein VGS57_11145 [Thermoanaerobaculia bacterium]|nr:hypothetical protein [Thermoanaerobaculia bacterium]
MALLKFQLRNLFDRLDNGQSSRLKLIRCAGRSPDGESSFPPMIAQDLVNRDVVLEIWGEVFPASAGNQLVFLNYAMLPLPASTAGRFLQRQYQPPVSGSPDKIADWLAGLNELTAYAKVARAVRALSSGEPAAYDDAKAELGDAAASLQQAFGTTPTNAEKELLAFVTARKCQVLRDARSNTAYNGPLKRLPPAVVERECPTGSHP